VPKTYILKDSRGQKILGAFYAQELKKTNHPDIGLISEIIKTDKRKNSIMFNF
jgi:hypothetical protein